VDEEYGVVEVAALGGRHRITLGREQWEWASRVLSQRQLGDLLAEIGEDAARFEDVARVAEELAAHVFRGRVRTEFDVYASLFGDLRFKLLIEGLAGTVDLVLHIGLHPRRVRGGREGLHYIGTITLFNRVGTGDRDALRLLGLFFEELAGILGVPEAGEEMRREGDLRILYVNGRVFWGEGLNPPRG
jgi:hypothetical protein